MIYLGGKSKLASEISLEILSRVPDKRGVYLEPFIGGGSMYAKLAPAFDTCHAGDTHEDLILMWSAFANGWTPGLITEETYNALKRSHPSALRGFVGFACSFGAKWFGGWARNTKCGEDRDYQASVIANAKIAKYLPPNRPGSLKCQPYYDWEVTAETVAYCDPPYRYSQAYSGKTFDSDEFWFTMTSWVKIGASVFVSEYSAPADWVPVLTLKHNLSVAGGMGVAHEREKLFVHVTQR